MIRPAAKRNAASCTLAAALCLTAFPAPAQEAAGPGTVPPEPPLTPAPVPLTIRGAPGKGVTFEQPGSFKMTLRGRFQVRQDLIEDDGEVTSQAQIRRARLTAEGYVFDPHIEYTMQLGFAAADLDEDRAPILDAYLTLSHLRDLKLRAGLFRVPFDRSNLISSGSLQFVDRAPVVNQVSLDRDIGVVLFSEDLFGLGERLAYSVGVFSGEGRGRAEAPSGLLYVARLETQPLGGFDAYRGSDIERLPRPRLAIAGSIGWNENSIRNRSNRGTVLPELAAVDEFDGFDFLHLEADTMFKWSGFSFMGEFLWRDARGDEATFTQPDGTTVTVLAPNSWGWSAQAGQMIGPKWEVVARYSEQRGMADTSPALLATLAESGRELGGGVNWFVHGHNLKLQANYFRRWGIARDEETDTRSFDDGIDVVQVQLATSF